MPNSELVQSVLKALELFRILAESETPLRLADLAGAAGVKVPTAHNLLRTLRARGFVRQDASGNYYAGTVMEELHRQILHRRILRLGGGMLRELAAAHPECFITLSEITHSAIVCRLRMSPDRPGELQHPTEMTFPPYAAVTSRCLQALAANSAVFETFYPFEEFGSRCPLSLSQLMEERAVIRKTGYCMQSKTVSGRDSLAVYIPDNYALGISVESGGSPLPLQDALSRVREFRKKLAAEREM